MALEKVMENGSTRDPGSGHAFRISSMAAGKPYNKDRNLAGLLQKNSGRQTLTLVQAVDEALCFGWIQSRLKPLDPQRFAVRFSPRHKGSIWSLPNLKRVRGLLAQGRMSEFGLAMLPDEFKE
jgi:uncharacterized protein YdeI (YjbR/CyaY-like superfamily)